MPQRRTGDVVHVVMTDHWIERGTSSGDLVAPSGDRVAPSGDLLAPHAEIPADFPQEGGKVRVWKGTGCRSCRQSGFRGRTGIHELMVTGETIRVAGGLVLIKLVKFLVVSIVTFELLPAGLPIL